MKRSIRSALVLFITLALLLGGMPTSILADEPSAANITELTIVHTNDTHGRYAASDSVVGFAKLKTLINAKEADLILDAGDTWHGQAFATVEQGESTAEVLKAVGYTAMTPGNHDFNYGKTQMKTLESIAETPLLSCNVIDNATGEPYFTPSMTMTTNDGIKVGVVGVTSPNIYSDTAPSNVEGLTFAEPTPYLQAEVDRLRDEEGCTVIVVLAHMGDSSVLNWTSDRLVSETNGVDVVIDGHTHDVENKVAAWADGSGQAIVVQTGCYFANVGVLTLSYDTEAQKVVNLSTQNEELISAADAALVEEDTAVGATISAIEEREADTLEQVVGTSPVDVNAEDTDLLWGNVRIGQQPIGNVITDAYLAATGADIAFENAGGIRSGLAAGDITYGDIIAIAPFGNYVVTKQVTGQTILDMLETNFTTGFANKVAYDTIAAGGSADFPENSGSYLQWGGINVTYDPDAAEGSRVVSVTVDGEALDPAANYTVATNNFVAVSDDYPVLAAADEINQYSACDEILIRYIGGEYGSDWTASIDQVIFSEAQDTPSEEIPSNGDNTDNTATDNTSMTVNTDNVSTNANTGIQGGNSRLVLVIAIVLIAVVLMVVLRNISNRKK